MITSSNTARTFAQSIASLAVSVQDDIDTADWALASDTLDSIASDVERLTAYVVRKLEESERDTEDG